MKKLSFEQMETVNAGSVKSTLSCISQVSGGMDVFWATIGMLCLGFSPLGLICLGFGAISLVTGAVVDPNACNS